MEPQLSTEVSNLCQICSSCPSKYTCPRCSIVYCSVNCYKSTGHVECSEEFYKKCVEEEINARSGDHEERKKMIEILKRFHTEDLSDNIYEEDEDEDILDEPNTSYEAIDSDDDDVVPDLADRIKNVDLDNADDIWAVLTDTEKQEFEAIIQNGQEYQLLPKWIPWWSQVIQEKLVHDVTEQEDQQFKNNCPKVMDVPIITAVEKASPLVGFNLLNILYAYALTVLHYNGEHQSSLKEALGIFLEFDEVIGRDKIFQDVESAVSSVLNKARIYKLLPDDNEYTTVTDAVKQIVQGPNNKYQIYYMAAALSDLYQLISQVRNEYSGKQKKQPNSEFSRQLNNQIKSRYANLTKKHLMLYMKKIEYYLAWINKYGVQMTDLLK